MSTLANEVHPYVQSARCFDTTLSVELLDGRTISVPISSFPNLSKASKSHKDNWELLGDGDAIHWPDLDEDLSVAGLLAGTH
jgi:hypothetical protein